MKLLKSQCGRAWLFNAKREGDTLTVGFACFLARCPAHLVIPMGKEMWSVLTPIKALESPVPVRIVGARLSVLSESA